MSSWNVADRLSGLTLPVAAVVAALLILAYMNRGWLAIWLLRRGMRVAERVLFEFLDLTGVKDPRWAIFQYPDRCYFRLGLVIDEEREHISIFVPSVPKLVPGDLVFVNRQYVRFLPELGLRDGMELLVTLGATSDKDAMNLILRKMGE